MWHHNMLPIRFMVTAFAAGPCLIILIFRIIRSNTKFWIEDEAINLLSVIVTWCLGLALFLSLSEIVVELYARTEHANGLYYLMFGLHGLTNLVPWFWGSLAAMMVAFAMFLTPSIRTNQKLLPIACVLAFGGIWVEKGMGLIVPGFIPSPIGEVTEYFPTLIEVMMTIGLWAMGFLLLTILLKGAIGIMLGDIRYRGDVTEKAHDFPTGGETATLEAQ